MNTLKDEQNFVVTLFPVLFGGLHSGRGLESPLETEFSLKLNLVVVY